MANKYDNTQIMPRARREACGSNAENQLIGPARTSVVAIEVLRCTKSSCRNLPSRALVTDLAHFIGFVWRTSIAIHHDLIHEYMTQFSASETPIDAFALSTRRRYSQARPYGTFCGRHTFQRVRLDVPCLSRRLRMLTRERSPTPGPVRRVPPAADGQQDEVPVLRRGTANSFHKKFLLSSLRPPCARLRHLRRRPRPWRGRYQPSADGAARPQLLCDQRRRVNRKSAGQLEAASSWLVARARVVFGQLALHDAAPSASTANLAGDTLSWIDTGCKYSQLQI